MDCADSIHKAHLISAVNHLPSTRLACASIKISVNSGVCRLGNGIAGISVSLFFVKKLTAFGKKKPGSINLNHKLYC